MLSGLPATIGEDPYLSRLGTFRQRCEAVLYVVYRLRKSVEAWVETILSKQKMGRLTSPPTDWPA